MVVLGSSPALYETSRSYGEVLEGTDEAAALLEASASGDDEGLQGLLSNPDQVKIALDRPHRIYSKDSNPSGGDEGRRTMLAMPILNLDQAMRLAAENNHPSTVAIALDFASSQNVNLIEREHAFFRSLIEKVVASGHGELFMTFVDRDPRVIHFPLAHGKYPLGVAVQKSRAEVVEFILTHKAFPKESARYGLLDRKWLLWSAAGARGSRVMELLLDHGFETAQSGALHRASERGAIELMRLLIEHGVDVKERARKAPNQIVAGEDVDWTPMDAAAARGQKEAMALLRSHGADPINVADGE